MHVFYAFSIVFKIFLIAYLKSHLCLWFACYTHTDRYKFISLYFSSESMETPPPPKIYVQREKENSYEMRKTESVLFKKKKMKIYKNKTIIEWNSIN